MFYPNRFDHDDALRACHKISIDHPEVKASDPCKEGSYGWAINQLNIVAGAYACNEKAYISHSEYVQALNIANKGES